MEYVSTYFWLHLKGDFQWFFMGEAKSHGWVGRGWLGRGSWVVGHVCLKIKKRYILAPSVLSQNLQLSANSFYEILNKGKLSPINY